MIDIHLHVVSIFAFLGVLATAIVAAYLTGYFTEELVLRRQLSSAVQDRASVIAALIVFLGGAFLLGWWAGLW